MGLADVLLMKMLRWLLVAVCLLKAIDALQFDHALALAWLVGLASLAAHERYGSWTLALITLGGAALDLPRMSNHVVLVGWIGLILAFWGDQRTRLKLLRIQACVVYFFAGLSKINPRFLTGEVIAERQSWLPLPQVLAVTAIAAEWALCVMVWCRWRWTIPIAAVFHAALVIGWTTDFLGHGPGILTFNVLVFAIVAVVVHGSPEISAPVVQCELEKDPPLP